MFDILFCKNKNFFSSHLNICCRSYICNLRLHLMPMLSHTIYGIYILWIFIMGKVIKPCMPEITALFMICSSFVIGEKLFVQYLHWMVHIFVHNVSREAQNSIKKMCVIPYWRWKLSMKLVWKKASTEYKWCWIQN